MANQVLEQLPIETVRRFTQRAPVNVEGLAYELGLTVYYDAEMESGVSGKILKAAPPVGGVAGYAIYVNGNDRRRRQRFTLAHEIAHFVLHSDLIGDGVIDNAMFRSWMSDHYERQANRMAADILVPAHLVKNHHRNGMVALPDLCKRFDVSEEAMRIRLKELGLAA